MAGRANIRNDTISPGNSPLIIAHEGHPMKTNDVNTKIQSNVEYEITFQSIFSKITIHLITLTSHESQKIRTKCFTF